MKKHFEEYLNYSKKISIICIITTCILGLVITKMFFESGIIKGINSNADEVKNMLLQQKQKQVTIEGDILDIHSNILCSSNTPGVDGHCLYPEYSWLIGYHSDQYGSFGIRDQFSKYLFKYNRKTNKGASVKLTLDHEMMTFTSSLLNSITNDGCIIILNNDTGAIQTFASRSPVEFDNNNIEKWINEANKIDASMYRRGTYEQHSVGSIFKLISSAAALEANVHDFYYYDTGVFEVEGYPLKNYGNMAYGALYSLSDALSVSSNTYFADLITNKVGYEAFRKTAAKFFVKDLELDFTTIHSTLGLDHTTFTLAMSAIGQGKMQVCPLMIAIWGLCFANDGNMMKPYLIDSIYDEDKELYKGESELIRQTVSKETADMIKKEAHQSAVKNGFTLEKYGYVWGKSSTAELSNGKIHSYLLMCSDQYTYLISSANAASSNDLYAPMKLLVEKYH